MSSYIPIASTVVSSPTATVTFSSVPTSVNGKTIRDLVLVCSPIDTAGYQTVNLNFNGDFGSNYREVNMYGDGSTVNSQIAFSRTSMLGQGFAVTGTERITIQFTIFDFAQTNKHKSALIRGDCMTLVAASSNRWANTAAITTIAASGSGNFPIGSTFSLFGIEA